MTDYGRLHTGLLYVEDRKNYLMFLPKGIDPKKHYPDHDYEPVTLDKHEAPIGCDMDQLNAYVLHPAGSLWECYGCGEFLLGDHGYGGKHTAIFTNYTRHGEPFQDIRECGPVYQAHTRLWEPEPGSVGDVRPLPGRRYG